DDRRVEAGVRLGELREDRQVPGRDLEPAPLEHGDDDIAHGRGAGHGPRLPPAPHGPAGGDRRHTAPLRWRKRRAAHPSGTRSQKVRTRKTRAAENATPAGIPATVRPPVRAASTGPMPPGDGTAAPTVFDVR